MRRRYPQRFSHAQAEAEEILRSLGNGKAVPPDVVNQVLEIINTVEQRKNNPTAKALLKNPTIQQLIKLQMLQEKDWRKRSVLAAMLFSENLNE